jgi:hypothetical protein
MSDHAKSEDHLIHIEIRFTLFNYVYDCECNTCRFREFFLSKTDFFSGFLTNSANSSFYVFGYNNARMCQIACNWI